MSARRRRKRAETARRDGRGGRGRGQARTEAGAAADKTKLVIERGAVAGRRRAQAAATRCSDRQPLPRAQRPRASGGNDSTRGVTLGF